MPPQIRKREATKTSLTLFWGESMYFKGALEVLKELSNHEVLEHESLNTNNVAKILRTNWLRVRRYLIELEEYGLVQSDYTKMVQWDSKIYKRWKYFKITNRGRKLLEAMKT